MVALGRLILQLLILADFGPQGRAVVAQALKEGRKLDEVMWAVRTFQEVTGEDRWLVVSTTASLLLLVVVGLRKNR